MLSGLLLRYGISGLLMFSVANQEKHLSEVSRGWSRSRPALFNCRTHFRAPQNAHWFISVRPRPSNWCTFFSSFSNFITTVLSLFNVSIHEHWHRTTWMSKMSILRLENCRTNCLWLSQPAAFTTDNQNWNTKSQGYVPAFVWCLSKHKGKRFILYSVKSLFSGKGKNRLNRPLPKVSLRSLTLIIASSLSAFYFRRVTSQYCSPDLRLTNSSLCSPCIYLLYKKNC